jgi:hypothetical protein
MSIVASSAPRRQILPYGKGLVGFIAPDFAHVGRILRVAHLRAAVNDHHALGGVAAAGKHAADGVVLAQPRTAGRRRCDRRGLLLGLGKHWNCPKRHECSRNEHVQWFHGRLLVRTRRIDITRRYAYPLGPGDSRTDTLKQTRTREEYFLSFL